MNLQDRYQLLAQSNDPIERAVAKRQLAALRGTQAWPALRQDGSVSAWLHVPLAQLFAEAGNALTERRNGSIVTGHQPTHDSKSGNCLVIWPAESRWWCSSCRRGGDAVAAVRSLAGVPYRAAVARLIDRFGPPGVAGVAVLRTSLQVAGVQHGA